MLKLLQIYFIVSFSLFTSVIAKLYTSSDSFFEAYVAIFEKKNFFVIILNFLLAIGIMFIMLIQYYFMGDFLETEYKQALNELHGIIVPIFMMMYYLNLEFVTFNFIALIFCRYLICLINVRVKSFSINYENSNAKSHRKMILLQFLLFLYCFNHLITHLKQRNDNPLNLALFNQYFLCCNFLFESIINQLIIISDEQNGNSINAYYNRQHISYYSSLISAAISVITALVIVYSRISNKKFFLFFTLFDPLQSIFSKISSYKKWKKFCTDLNILLSSPTDEELQEHDTCIICRMKLTKNAKKLPCGHIFHLDCMIVWFGTRQVCPICGADIHELLKQANQNNHQHDHEVNNEADFVVNNEDNENQDNDIQYNYTDFENNDDHDKKEIRRHKHRRSRKHQNQDLDNNNQEKTFSFSDFDILDDNDSSQQNTQLQQQNEDDINLYSQNLMLDQGDQPFYKNNNNNDNNNYHGSNAELAEELRQTRELLKEFEQRVRFLESKLQNNNE